MILREQSRRSFTFYAGRLRGFTRRAGFAVSTNVSSIQLSKSQVIRARPVITVRPALSHSSDAGKSSR